MAMTQIEKKYIISENFNRDLYSRILRVRQAQGLKTHIDEENNHGLIPNHPLKGKKLINRKTGEVLYIQDVYKHWLRGYYINLLYYKWYEHMGKKDKSHGTCMWEDICCHEKWVLNIIKRNNKKYKIE